MPVKKCQKDGKNGYKWGDQGKCYTGPGAKKKAIKQGMAIHSNSSIFEEGSIEDLKYALDNINDLCNDSKDRTFWTLALKQCIEDKIHDKDENYVDNCENCYQVKGY